MCYDRLMNTGPDDGGRVPTVAHRVEAATCKVHVSTETGLPYWPSSIEAFCSSVFSFA